MRRCRGSWLCAVFLVIALISGFAIVPGISLAQADGPSVGGEVSDANETAEDAENIAENESEDSEDEAGGLLDRFSEEGAPSGGGTTGTGNGLGETQGSATGGTAGGFLDGTSEWAEEGATNAIPAVIDGTLQLATGAPTMDNSGWLGIFGTPTSPPYDVLFEEIHEGIIWPLTLSFLVMALLLSAGVMPFGSIIGQYNASRWAMTLFVLIIALSLSWPIVSAMHALSDAIGTGIAPTSDELLGTEEGLRTLGGASVAGAVGFYIFGWIKVIIYGLIYGMRYFLLMMVFPYLFPLALTAALAAPWRKLRSLGSAILWQHVGFLVMGWPIALLWRAAYAIDWGFGLEGLANLLMIIGSLVSGVVIPIVLMYQMTKLTGVVKGAAVGASASLAARQSYRPKSIDHARSAGSRARDIGRSASSRAYSAAQTVKYYTPVGTATTQQTRATNQRSGRGRGRSNTGSTQSSRRKAARHMIQKRRQRRQNAQRGD